MLDSSGKGFQTFVHSIEQGKFAPILKGGAGGIALLAITLLYLFIQFSGLDTATAMDQAQISRNLMMGEGFSTKYIRPLALWQLNRAEKEIPAEKFPDISQPPLFPALNVIPLSIVKGNLQMERDVYIYPGDRAIAITSVLLFFAAALVGYFVARRLFDAQLALLATIVVLATDILWKFSLSGLSHSLLLLLLMSTAWLIVKAMDGQEETGMATSKRWILAALIGAMFGLMTLTNWVACWLFFGYLFFAFFYFKPRILPLASIVVFALVLTPWIVRNVAVCGHPFGLAIYPMGREALMRSMEPDFAELFYGFKMHVRVGIIDQIGNLLSYLGLNLAAGAFFLALFHPFKRPTTAHFRWCVLAMWVLAVLGMAVYGPIRQPIAEVQLHSIFIPLFVFFGLAFLLVLWNRLGFQHSLMRLVFNVLIVFICGIPMLLALFAGQTRMVNWPPYVPPYIAVLEKLYKPDEAICSDMPWAVAWYANRKSLLLPESPKTMIEISDYEVLGQPIRGLFLTPVTGNLPLMSDIILGDYKPWAGPILRQPQMVKGFPFRAVTGTMEGQVVLYADHDRWSKPREEATTP
jgi:hypothetical protein